MQQIIKLSCCIAFLFVIPLNSAVAKNDGNKQALEQVQKKIEKQHAAITKHNKDLKKYQTELKQREIEIGSLSRKIRQNKIKSKETQKQLKTLNKKLSSLNTEKENQQQVLAKQLESAYRTGHYDYLKVILNQQDPGKIERTITYYKYLTKARLKSLDNLKQTLDDIAKNTQEVKTTQASLLAISVELKQKKSALALERKSREQALSKVKKLLSSDKERLAQLQESEAEMQAQIKLALKKLTRIAQTGLKKFKGKLAWPTKGKVIHKYGSRHTGTLKRKGLVIAAPEGRLVSSVHSGQVVFANWLKGYGLVVVIDHGKGYMSLYGYNQSLLRQVGDRVESGESIATVGDSGGQQRTALYFELRLQGKPINPISWLARKH